MTQETSSETDPPSDGHHHSARNVAEQAKRARRGLQAACLAGATTAVLFAVKLVLGFQADSIAVLANAFHHLSHLASAVILGVSFWLTSRPATGRTPFGHGRMEHIAPLIMAVLLFVSGLRLGEEAVHRIINPHHLHYFAALPWLLGATVIVKQITGECVRRLGNRIRSHAVLAAAAHHRIEGILSVAVIAGIVAGQHLEVPYIDGSIGLIAALWLLYLGCSHGRDAVVPLLGQAPSAELIADIRKTARGIEGVEDVHEIIVHDYGNKYLLSLHVEIPEKLGSVKIHELTEECEEKLRQKYGGEVVAHADPLLEKTPEVQKVEEQFSKIVQSSPDVHSYHDFRVVAASENRIIIAADIDAAEGISEERFPAAAGKLEKAVLEQISGVAYCSFYVTPKFAY